MRAHQVMTRNVITVTPETTIAEAASRMLQNHISGLPVLDDAGELVGIVSEGDFLRRFEIGTQRRRPKWLEFLVGPGKQAADFVHERGRKIGEVMTRDPVTVGEETALDELVQLMETKHIKRLPVVQDGRLTGIITRANLMRAVVNLAQDVPDPTANDDHIRARITRLLMEADWRPAALEVTVRDGVVHLHGLIIDERARQACKVAAENVEGVKEVHDHLCYVDTWSGFYLESPEDVARQKESERRK